MKWVLIDGTHINTDNVRSFYWDDDVLYIYYDTGSYNSWPDPDKDKAYPNQDLFDWHHRLTGSCMAGRNAFVKDRGLTLDGETTVTEFIRLTKNAYGGSTIKALQAVYEGA